MNIPWTKKKKRKAVAAFLIVSFLLLLVTNAITVENVTRWKALALTGGVVVLGAIGFLLEVELPPRVQKVVRTLFLLFLPFCTIGLGEVMQAGGALDPIPLLLNYILLSALYLLVFGISGSVVATTLIPTILVGILGAINHYVIFYRGASLQPWDIFAARTAANVLPAMQLQLDWPVVLTFYTVFALFGFSLWMGKREKHTSYQWKRLARCGVLSVLCFGVIGYTMTTKISALSYTQWDTLKATRNNGMTLNLVMNLRTMVNNPPEGYSTTAVEEAVQQANEQKTQEASQASSSETQQRPSIICIMSEAFSDLSVYGELDTNTDVLAGYHSLSGDNVIKGHTIVPVFGSGTCNSEYEFLTGNSTAMLRQGSYPLTQFVNDTSPSLVWNMKTLGYDTLAIHPYYANSWNRVRAYPYLGFDDFISLEDMEDPEIVRKYVSDNYDYELIKQAWENKGENPLFLFNVTMQNHLGFDIKYDNFTEDVSFPEEESFPSTKQYLSLIKLTDQETTELLDYFSNQEEPVIVMLFGDHQPSLEYEFYDMMEAENGWDTSSVEYEIAHHTTPFFIWSNYDIDSDLIEDRNDVTISANYLSLLLSDVAGLPKTPWLNYLETLYEQLPVLTTFGCVDAEGNVMAYPSGDSPYADLIETYHSIQYNQVFDNNGQQDELYYLSLPEDDIIIEENES